MTSSLENRFEIFVGPGTEFDVELHYEELPFHSPNLYRDGGINRFYGLPVGNDAGFAIVRSGDLVD